MKTNSIFYKVIVFISLFSFSILAYSQTANWTGNYNNNWDNSSNWSTSEVPDGTIDVTIPSTYSNKPVVSSIQSVKNITIQSGAELEIVLNGSLLVNNNCDVYGTLKMTNGSITVMGIGRCYENSDLIIKAGTLTADSCVLDSLSLTKYDSNNPEIYPWDHGNITISGSDTATIDGSYSNPTICDELTLNIPLKINSGKALKVEGGISNNTDNKAIFIKANTSSPAALMHNTSNIEASIHLKPDNPNKNYRWYYISSPVGAANVSIFNGDYVYSWDATQTWEGIPDYSPWQLLTNQNLEVAKGYAAYTNLNNVIFSGYLNCDNYNISLFKSSEGDEDNQGWNLIGNPYVTPLDWDRVVADDGFSTGIESAVYFFDDDDQTGSQSNYRYYVPSDGGHYGVGTEDASSIIPVCQSFFVKTDVNNISLDIKRKHRVFANHALYKKLEKNKIIRLSLTDNVYSDELVFRAISSATQGFDSNFDARKLYPESQDIPLIFSNDLNQSPNMAINTVSNFDENISLPIGIKANEGTYTLNIDQLSISNQNAYLVDYQQTEFIKLKEDETYTFNHQGGIDLERFKIVFNKPNNNNLNKNSYPNIKIYPNPVSNFLHLNLSFNANQTIANIVNLTGESVKSVKLNSLKNKIDISDLKNGVYILNVYTNNCPVYTKKIIIQ